MPSNPSICSSHWAAETNQGPRSGQRSIPERSNKDLSFECRTLVDGLSIGRAKSRRNRPSVQAARICREPLGQKNAATGGWLVELEPEGFDLYSIDFPAAIRRVSELASSLIRNQMSSNGLWVRLPCPPLFFQPLSKRVLVIDRIAKAGRRPVGLES